MTKILMTLDQYIQDVIDCCATEEARDTLKRFHLTVPTIYHTIQEGYWADISPQDTLDRLRYDLILQSQNN